MSHDDPLPLGEHSARFLERERLAEELLVLRACQGSRGAFEHLARRWHERFWRHAYRLCGNRETADDVLQESWLAVARGLTRLKDPRSFGRWAYTIVTRAAVSALRKSPRERSAPPESLEEHVRETESESDRAEALALLRLALAQLESHDRALVSLRYLEGFDVWELAQILSIPEGTVKSRLHRIRKRLREILERTQS